MAEGLRPCPLCGSTNITCFAEYDGDSYENESIYRAVVACLGCHEDGCDPSYDEEPCFGIEVYFPGSHPLLNDCEDPSDCERVLERHMAERWNRRVAPTCHMEQVHEYQDEWESFGIRCSLCGEFVSGWMSRSLLATGGKPDMPWPNYCPNCGEKVVDE